VSKSVEGRREAAEVGRMEDGFSFVHAQLGTLSQELLETRASLLALLDLCVRRGWLAQSELEELRLEIRQRLLAAAPPDFALNPSEEDKHAAPPVLVDCDRRLSACNAACCRRSLVLTRQDLAEGALRWDPLYPYWLLQESSGACHHLDPQTLRCTMYADRPLACRCYSCEQDPSVWEDFERMVPACGQTDVRSPGGRS
jgi:hypothetical protein